MSGIKESRTNRFLRYAIPILLMVYILSTGPVAVSVEDSRGNVPPEYQAPLRTFYAPLLWLMDRNYYCRILYAEYHRICSPNY